MNVDLILLSFDENPFLPDWSLGEVRVVNPTITALNDLVTRFLPQTGVWLFWSSELGQPDPGLISRTLLGPADIYHAGLALGAGGLPHAIDFVSPTWMLNCDPPANIEATSWRVSLKACLVRVDVLRQMGFLHPGFHSLDAAVLDWGHRCIRRGVIMRHLPSLVVKPKQIPSPIMDFNDELQFIRLRFGKKWQIWTSFRALISFRVRLGSVLKANINLMGESVPLDPAPFQREVQLADSMPEDVRVSVLIPTMDRYPYLQVLLSQLREQIHRAYEIIIVDQTPLPTRNVDFYDEFVDLPLKVVFLDRPGQCSSRNAGLKTAGGGYILFIDDDDEVPPDLIEAHLNHLMGREADVSSGVANEISAGPLPVDFTYPRMSDVFPTNNSLICRSILQRSGLFDLAYDHGARADADVGMRMYLSGTLMLLNPEIAVLHHHAPRGGLRSHKARVVTYASSRASLIQRQILSATEIYYSRRYFRPQQVQEFFWLAVFSGFSLVGPLWRRILKAIVSFILLPDTLMQLWRNARQADELMEKYPIIPTVQNTGLSE